MKRAISAEACREFSSRSLPKSKIVSPVPELGRDVTLLSLCPGRINTADLYDLKKADYKDGIICYKWDKTHHSRKNEAYMEMRVETFIQPIFYKYLSRDANDAYLFNFHTRFRDFDSLNANVNNGLKTICEDMGMPKEERYCFYTFRHTGATIAPNDCGVSISDMDFGMNHRHGFNVTRGYIKVDFRPAWELNEKVMDFIFFSNKKSKQGATRDIEDPKDAMFRVTKKMMIYGGAYFKGNLVGELTDICFSNVREVISSLVKQLPMDYLSKVQSCSD